MKNLILLITSLLLFIGSAFACKPETKPPPSTQEFRIVALTPSIAEIVCSLGFSKQLVAASKFTNPELCPHYKPIATLPTDIEQIVSLKPNLILLHPSDTDTAQRLNQIGLKSEAFSMDSLEEIDAAILKIANLLNAENHGKTLLQQMHLEIDEIQKNDKISTPLDVVLVVEAFTSQRSSIFIAQNNAYLAQLVKICGANPIAWGKNNWKEIDMELLIRLNPTVIIHFAKSSDKPEDVLKIWKKNLPMLQAAEKNNIIVLNDESLTQPGSQVANSLRSICKSLRGQRAIAEKKAQ